MPKLEDYNTKSKLIKHIKLWCENNKSFMKQGIVPKDGSEALATEYFEECLKHLEKI